MVRISSTILESFPRSLLLRAALATPVLFHAGLAQADSANAAAAEALFNEGKRLMEAADYERACPKLAESQRLDPGTGTLLNLATCYERAGKKATAWLTWIEAARSSRAAGQTDRETLARENATRLEGSLGRLTITVADGAPAGLVVKRNGETLPQATWGTPLPLDAGVYHVEASAPEHQTLEKDITVVDGRTVMLDIPPLPKADAAPDAEKKKPEANLSTTPKDSGPSDGSAQRTWGYVLGGVGIVGVGVGSVLGVMAISKNDESKRFCSTANPNSCSQSGVDARNSAFGMATGSTVAIGIGAAALVTGFVLVLTAPSGSTEVAVVPTGDGGALSFRGSF